MNIKDTQEHICAFQLKARGEHCQVAKVTKSQFSLSSQGRSPAVGLPHKEYAFNDMVSYALPFSQYIPFKSPTEGI